MSRRRLPPRVQQVIIDNEAHTYPLTQRFGENIDSGSVYDDTRALIFRENTPVMLPTLLPVTGAVTLGQLTSSYGVVRKGVVDGDLPFETGPYSFEPFKETRLNDFDFNDPFYATGSKVEDVGAGFTTPLWSKHTISIDLAPVREHTHNFVVIDSDSQANYAPSYPIQYFNHTDKTWEGIYRGIPIDWSLFDKNYKIDVSTQALGFGPSMTHQHFYANNEESLMKNAALPMDLYGFPYDGRYHATSSQMLSLHDKIPGPFLLEKIVYEFSATMQYDSFAYDYVVPITTFFILNQRKISQFVHTKTITERHYDGVDFWQKTKTDIVTLPTASQLVTGTAAPVIEIDTIRDLVTYMQVSNFDTEYTQARLLSGSLRDLNISNLAGDWTGKYVMSASCKSLTRNDGTLSLFTVAEVSATYDSFLDIANSPGGRTGYHGVTGRSLKSDIPSSGNPTAINYVDVGGGETAELRGFVSQTIDNPYILLPTDKLIFGWQVPINIRYNPPEVTSLTLHTGVGKCILYGSLLRENKEVGETYSQPLTQPSIHEAIVGSEGLFDQFLTQPFNLLSDTYNNLYITGSLNADIQLSRRVIGRAYLSGDFDLEFNESISTGHENRALLHGASLFAQHSSLNERYYDTLMPSISEIATINTRGLYARLVGTEPTYNVALIGTTMTDGDGGPPYVNMPSDSTWIRSFPFETRYSTVSRILDPLSLSEASIYFNEVDAFGVTSTKKFLKPLTVAYGLQAIKSDYPEFPISYLRGRDEVAANPRDTILHLYGVGDMLIDSVSGMKRVRGVLGQFGDRPQLISGSVFQGFKYGILNPFPQFSRVVFRFDRFGQFRDMLEQRLDGKFYDVVGFNPDGTTNGQPNSLSSPVSVRFVERSTNKLTKPRQTFSSNLSNEATSSLPYFDGKVRNREEPLDTTILNTYTVVL